MPTPEPPPSDKKKPPGKPRARKPGRGATILQARGEFAELTRQAVVRLVFVLLLTTTLVATLHADAAFAAGAALLASEALVSGRLWWLLRRHAPPVQIWP